MCRARRWPAAAKKAGRPRRSPRSASRRWGDTSTSSTSTVTFLAPRWSVEAKRKKRQKENSVTFSPTSPCLGKTSRGMAILVFRHFRLYRKIAKGYLISSYEFRLHYHPRCQRAQSQEHRPEDPP